MLPIEETDVNLGMEFLTNYMSHIMDRKEKTFLMLVLLYQYNSESKGSLDVFGEVKKIATKTANKYKNEDTKMAWVSIRLPQLEKPISIKDYRALNFGLIDLSLKKVGLDSLVLFLDVRSNVTVDFLNRV